MHQAIIWSGFLCALLWATQTEALTLHSGLQTGVMQQPSSQYYHSTYGAYADIRSENAVVFSRVSYFERPEYKAAGFSDQEFGAFFHLGTALSDYKKSYSLLAAIGYGQIAGVIKNDGYDEKYGQQSSFSDGSRHYHLNGLIYSLEANWRISAFELAIGTQLFNGVYSNEELGNKVSWPFSFYNLRIGFAI